MTRKPKPSRSLVALGLLAGLAFVVSFLLSVYRPDRPVADIVPGTSSGPSFVAQIIRPRAGLPLGGIVPPQLFGQAAHLGFDSASAGAFIGVVGPGRLELGADDWELVVVLDDEGRVTPETRVVCGLVLAGRLRRVRCRPADPAVGTFDATSPTEAGELGGRFDIELARCEDAETGKVLGWPPRPLVLHGSFDRLPLDDGAQRESARKE